MIASLPMYDWPETEGANDRFWSLIRAQLLRDGVDPPPRLDRENDREEIWRSGAVLLSQTCGLPFRAGLHARLQLVGSPDTGLTGCEPGYYASVLVAARKDARIRFEQFAGSRLAYNGTDSQSGWAAPVAEADERRIAFGSYLETGSHLRSAEAVSRGDAEIAALDPASWQLIRRFRDWSRNLKTIGRTSETPGLPFVTSYPRLASALFRAVDAAARALDPRDRELVPCRRLVRIPKDEYLRLPLPPSRPPAAATEELAAAASGT